MVSEDPLSPLPAPRRSSAAAKLLFDLLLAGAGLVVLAPVMVAIAVCIRLDSPGPVFFRQQRVGRHGALFRIHKFRTMAHAPSGLGLPLTVGADARVTRAGRWLRRTRLDELPQLIDVLAGSMSLVGPRPEVPRYVALYPPALRDKVLSVRPGITDPASLLNLDESEVLGRAADPEQAYVEEVLPAKLRCSALYVDQRSLIGDLRLLGRTLKVIFR